MMSETMDVFAIASRKCGADKTTPATPISTSARLVVMIRGVARVGETFGKTGLDGKDAG